jgi:hypothetical protein
MVEKKSPHKNMGRGKGVSQNDIAHAIMAHNNAITNANGYSRGYGLGTGIKEDWNNSRFGKNVNKFVKKHKNVIDAVRNDESVQNLYHSKHIAPLKNDIHILQSDFDSYKTSTNPKINYPLLVEVLLHHYCSFWCEWQAIQTPLSPLLFYRESTRALKGLFDDLRPHFFLNKSTLLEKYNSHR